MGKYSFIEKSGLTKMTHFLKSRDLYPFFKEVSSPQTDVAFFGDKKVLMFGSNNYLGLNNHPEIKKAAQDAITKYGTSCTGSRFMNGTLSLHRELEDALKDFLKQEAAIVFPTGFQVNLGVIPALTGKDDSIFIDELNHASIIDGCQLSYAKRIKYKHNNIEDLQKKLALPSVEGSKKLIVTDGIFSMDGDIAKLDKIVEVAKKHDAITMVDCAHAIGVIGENGSGTASHFNVSKEVDLIGGTFSKSLASVGGFVAGDADMIEYLAHASRSFMFSASLPPASVASALAALKIMRTDNSFNEKLWENTHYAIEKMREFGLDIGETETPIIPVYIRNSEKTFKVAKMLFENGVYVNPVVSPAVKDSDSLLRFSLTSAHNKEQVLFAVTEVAKAIEHFSKQSIM
ncbi:pyridoxal phosphate-dependent aminotransferase family protein [uncultured Algibacter sp.]|uniref:aminotransferase class I/II-fold pyridoxal phosphate-dependent enzyme n=1 Tax=uncultured Algibacter sp. TaxID=298659 RepID=UPI0026248FB5|nr:pyridoxal phosphate-dependent aminotransferase family protein [uncultured Algibacter sp.]